MLGIDIIELSRMHEIIERSGELTVLLHGIAKSEAAAKSIGACC